MEKAESECLDNQYLLREHKNLRSWWTNKDRWSYGSDTSEPPDPSSQNRLCCSPVDDSTLSSENEDGILVNNLNESYGRVSPASSSVSEKKSCDDTADDEIIDYSKRYTTERGKRQQRRAVSDYAETDLDQPTNYSLMYAEEDYQYNEFYVGSAEGQEDTVMAYCTEGTPYDGTPYSFSNATSLSDLRSIDDRTKPVKIQKVKQVCKKKVENNSAQETPLMFSRSSSVDSLSEFDQDLRAAVVQDDRSSIVSDFSHRTSVVVSPSDLPDSPTQARKLRVPPQGSCSEKIVKQRPQQQQQQQQQTYKINHARNDIFDKPTMKNSVFEDTLVRFKDESLSRGSLSSLSINDDQIDECDSNKIIPQPQPSIAAQQRMSPLGRCCENPAIKRSVFEDTLVRFKEECLPRQAHSTTNSSLSALIIDDELDDVDDEAVMMRIANLTLEKIQQQKQQQKQPAAICNNRASISSPKLENQTMVGKIFQQSGKNQGKPMNKVNMKEVAPPRMMSYRSQSHNGVDSEEEDENLLGAYINTKRNDMYKQSLNNHRQQQQQQQRITDDIVQIDHTHTYYTENTPTYISRCGSQSNLSQLSIFSSADSENQSPRVLGVSEASSNCSEEEEEEEEEEELRRDNGQMPGRRRIDVSPFDSQLNLAHHLRVNGNCSSEEEELGKNETDSPRNYYGTNNSGAASSIYDISDSSEEDEIALEECIRSGFSKVTRRQNATMSNDGRRYL